MIKDLLKNILSYIKKTNYEERDGEYELPINRYTSISRTPKELYILQLQTDFYAQKLIKKLHKKLLKKGVDIVSPIIKKTHSDSTFGAEHIIYPIRIPVKELDKKGVLIGWGDYGLYGELLAKTYSEKKDEKRRRADAMWQLLHDHLGVIVTNDLTHKVAEKTGIDVSLIQEIIEETIPTLFEEELKGVPGFDEKKVYENISKKWHFESKFDYFNNEMIDNIIERTVLYISADYPEKSMIKKQLLRTDINQTEPIKIADDIVADIRYYKILSHIKPDVYKPILDFLESSLLQEEGKIRVLLVPSLNEAKYYKKELIKRHPDYKIFITPIEEGKRLI
jgi:hypothetical protein